MFADQVFCPFNWKLTQLFGFCRAAAGRNRTDESLVPMVRIRSQSANESSKPMNHRRATLTGPKPSFSPSGKFRLMTLVLSLIIFYYHCVGCRKALLELFPVSVQRISRKKKSSQ